MLLERCDDKPKHDGPGNLAPSKNGTPPLIHPETQAVIDSLPFYTMLVDSNHTIVAANAAVQKQLGVNPEDIVGRHCPKVIHGIDGPYQHCPLELAVSSGSSAEKEFYEERLGRWLVSSVHPIRGLAPTGKPVFFHMLHDIHDLRITQHRLKETVSTLRRVVAGCIDSFGAMVEVRDLYTSGHQKRVSQIAVAIADLLGLTDEQRETIQVAAKLHDIGKVSIPLDILNRPSALEAAEMDIVKRHPRIGYDILRNIEFPWPVAQVVLQHHERCDGSGYPQGLRGPDIMLEARVIAVADVVEAMTSHRPYRPALGLAAALEEIRSGSGTKYDSMVVDACMAIPVEFLGVPKD